MSQEWITLIVVVKYLLKFELFDHYQNWNILLSNTDNLYDFELYGPQPAINLHKMQQGHHAEYQVWSSSKHSFLHYHVYKVFRLDIWPWMTFTDNKRVLVRNMVQPHIK